MKFEDVVDIPSQNRFLVTVGINKKNQYSGQLIVGSLFYDKVKNCISKRNDGAYTELFLYN